MGENSVIPDRMLAQIVRVNWLRPIEGADRIELAGVLGWQVIVRKGDFNVGDLAVYFNTSYLYTVETVGPFSYGRLRLLGSILVSSSESIHNDGALPLLTVITQPSSASFPPTNVTVVPTGTLFTDPLVQ